MNVTALFAFVAAHEYSCGECRNCDAVSFARLRMEILKSILLNMENHQKMEVPNTIVFHRRAGDKVCQVQWAGFSAHRTENGFELFFYVRGEQIEESALTNAEVSIFVDEFDLQTLVGRRFEVPSTYDNERDEHVSCVYYYDHKDFDNIVLKVLSREDDSLHVHWSGTTGDIDFYDGSEPDNRVVINAIFELQETREATYNYPVIKPREQPRNDEQADEQYATTNLQLSLWPQGPDDTTSGNG